MLKYRRLKKGLPTTVVAKYDTGVANPGIYPRIS
jgi:hypothetical protein